MIRFLQTPGPIKKIVLGGLLTIICVLMAITLIPGFGNSSFTGASTNPGIVATVSGDEITTAEVRREARQEVQQRYPRGGPEAQMALTYYTGAVFQRMVSRKIALAEAHRLGLHVSNDEIQYELEHGPYASTFFPGGKFIGQKEYEDLLLSHDLTIPQFEKSVGEDILMRKLSGLIAAGAGVTDAEVRKQFEKQNTKVKFNYAVIKKDDVLKSIHPADAELKAYYERNKQTYVNSVPEKRQLKYVVFDNAKLLAQTQVTQDELQGYYDQHRDDYRVPEQVDVRQILIKKPLPGDDGKVDQKAVEAAHAKADDVLKQLKSGGNFAELAKKYSEDTGTAKNGGSLGWIKPDAFPVQAVSKAVASLGKGATSDVIDAGYAFVILHVDDKQEAHVKSLDDVKPQIEPLIKQQKAAQAAQHESEQLLSDARSTSLEKAAATKGLQVITTNFVTSKDVLPGIGSDPQFMSAVFAQSANAPPDEAQLHQGYAIYQVTAVKPPATPTFEEIRSEVEQEFKNERASQLLTQRTQELADRAKVDHDLKKAAKESGAEFKTSDFVLPDAQVPDLGSLTGPAAVAFTLKPGETSGPIDTGNTGAVLSVV
ncbi:MAG TPA: peptidyl-prolyl cis-trans isomerase, partial [Terriglobales bacterium]|nr:peptidyl-prolyl cis-trans isomerase [Terriglobales bacterium]